MVDQHILDRTWPKNSMPLHECLLGRKFDKKHSLILSFHYSVCKSQDHQEKTEEPPRTRGERKKTEWSATDEPASSQDAAARAIIDAMAKNDFLVNVPMNSDFGLLERTLAQDGHFRFVVSGTRVHIVYFTSSCCLLLCLILAHEISISNLARPSEA